MGNLLPKPITSKLVQIRHGANVRMSAVSMQGCRLAMEDECAVAPKDVVSVAAVFDGHSGRDVSEACRRLLPQAIQQLPEITAESLRQLFIAFNHEHFKNTNVGSTAVVLVMTPTSIFIAHIGDSRAYVKVANETEYRLLTPPHIPSNPEESARIIKAGRFVAENRVSGSLAISRAFGDAEYSPAVIAEPDVIEITRDGQARTFVLVSDGLLEKTTDQAVMEALSSQSGVEPHLVGVHMCDWALKNGSTDNCAVLMVETDGPIPDIPPIDHTFGMINLPKMHTSQYEKAYAKDLLRYSNL